MFNNLLVLLIMCKCLVKVLNHLKVPILLRNVLVFNCSILGIQSAQLIRITARADGSGCDVYYKNEASRSGWCPRPSQSSVYTPIWKTMFKHPTDELQGHPVSATLTPIEEQGHRQSWQYLVTYFGMRCLNLILR